MPDLLTLEEQQSLKAAVEDPNEKAWAIGLGLTLASRAVCGHQRLLLKGGSHVGSHLQLLGRVPVGFP